LLRAEEGKFSFSLYLLHQLLSKWYAPFLFLKSSLYLIKHDVMRSHYRCT
jgi:hypothetical protein